MGNIAAGEVHSEAFLRVPPDAVSRSIAGASLAYPIGAVDLFVNPALLSQHRRQELQFSNMIDLLSTRYLSSAYSVAIGERHAIGVGLAGLNVVAEDFFLFLFSLDRYENEPVQMNAGVVVTPVTNQLSLKNFSLRAGLGNFDPGAQTENNISDYLRDSAPTFSIGAGLGMNMGTNWEIDLDYCFQIIEFITNQHIITTRIRF